jgi:hypothetical protein
MHLGDVDSSDGSNTSAAAVLRHVLGPCEAGPHTSKRPGSARGHQGDDVPFWPDGPSRLLPDHP